MFAADNNTNVAVQPIPEIYSYVCMYLGRHMWLRTFTNLTYGAHVCMQTYIHTYTHMHTYIATWIHTYIHTYIHTCIHSYIHDYIHTYTHTSIITYMSGYTYMP